MRSVFDRNVGMRRMNVLKMMMMKKTWEAVHIWCRTRSNRGFVKTVMNLRGSIKRKVIS